MIEDPKKIIEKIDTDLNSLLSRPRMWGGDEAVEMQFLTYMSLREFILGDGEIKPVPDKHMMSIYHATLVSHFGTSVQPACYLLNRGIKMNSDEKTKRLCEILSEVRKTVSETK